MLIVVGMLVGMLVTQPTMLIIMWVAGGVEGQK